MSKLVWRENSLYNISLYFLQNMWLDDVDTKLQMVPESGANGI